MREGVSVEEAGSLILEETPVLGSETIAAAEAAGRVLAEPIVSTRRHPPADCSAMDGYAVRRRDLAGASESSPIELPVVYEVPAGGQAAQLIVDQRDQIIGRFPLASLNRLQDDRDVSHGCAGLSISAMASGKCFALGQTVDGLTPYYSRSLRRRG